MKNYIIFLIIVAQNFCFCNSSYCQTPSVITKITELVSQSVKQGSPKRWDDLKAYLNSDEIDVIEAELLVQKLNTKNDVLRELIIDKTSETTLNRTIKLLNEKYNSSFGSSGNAESLDIKSTDEQVELSISIESLHNDISKRYYCYRITIPKLPSGKSINDYIFLSGKYKDGTLAMNFGPNTVLLYDQVKEFLKSAKSNPNFKYTEADGKAALDNINPKIKKAMEELQKRNYIKIKL